MSNEYNIIFSYALVNFYKLLDRNKLRSLKQMKLFNNSNYLTPAPRLPNISIDEFKKTTKNIERMLVLLRNVCLRRGRPPIDICGVINSNPNNILLIFDNDDIQSKLIYNSLTNDKFMSEQEFITLLTISLYAPFHPAWIAAIIFLLLSQIRIGTQSAVKTAIG